MNINKKIKYILKSKEALLITNIESILYYTNFQYHNNIKYILLVNNKCFFFINNFNIENFIDESIIKFTNYKNLFMKINEILNNYKIHELKIEVDDISYSNYELIINSIQCDQTKKVKNIFDSYRAIKSSFEVNKIIKAQKINEKAFNEALNFIKPGITELKLKNYLIEKLYNFGAHKLAFDPIISFGINTSYAHHISNNTVLVPGDFIMMDFGCVYDYYCSDMTRTFGFNYLSSKQKKIYDIVLKTQKLIIDYIKAGLTCSEVELFKEEILRKFGYLSACNHSVGHSLGINIHEYPFLNKDENYILRSGNIITIEPGIYLLNKFGVRIEDMIYINNNDIINITNIDKKLFIIK